MKGQRKDGRDGGGTGEVQVSEKEAERDEVRTDGIEGVKEGRRERKREDEEDGMRAGVREGVQG